MVTRGMGIALIVFFAAGYLMGFKNLMMRQEKEAMQMAQQQIQGVELEEKRQEVSGETDSMEAAVELKVVPGEETVEEQVIYNENDVIIKVIGLGKREIFGGVRTELKLSIQNNAEGSKNKITAKARHISVNGFMLGYMDAVDVEAWGDEEEAVIYFWDSELENRQIETKCR
ncbi:hypothetical protein [Candidatus Proelusimicrobium excrementi]|uniref:hypothetical protein n=1 Tax=Candidatus Proelusimicrobium excrementi TaxID=3416222 RepID=UPI003D133375